MSPLAAYSWLLVYLIVTWGAAIYFVCLVVHVIAEVL